MPRLSVDIDLNYIGAGDRASMLVDRPRVELALQQVAGRMGLTVKRAPTEHAGGKWRLSYVTALGRPAQLIPMLKLNVRPAKSEIVNWTKTLVRETRELMASVLPLTRQEMEFLERLNAAGEIVPELLTGAAAMQSIIRNHPGLKWKALNVKKHIAATTPASLPTKRRDPPH